MAVYTANGPPSPVELPNSRAIQAYLRSGTMLIAQIILFYERKCGSVSGARGDGKTHALRAPIVSSGDGAGPAEGKIALKTYSGEVPMSP